MPGPGDDSGEFHAVVSEKLDQLAKENQLLRDVINRLLVRDGEPDPRDELAARRRRKREQRRGRNAGFIALPIAVGALLRHSFTRGAMAAASAGTIALAAGATILAVDSHPLHPASPPVPAAHSSRYRTPRRATPITPRRGQGKGTAARSTTDTLPPSVSRSRAAVPHTTAPATQPATLPVVTVPSPHTHPPSPLPTSQPIPAILPSPIPSATKVIGHLVCHLNLLGIRVCVTVS